MKTFLQFENLKSFSGLTHFISTRQGGVSTGTFNSLNLSTKSGDDAARVIQNRQLLARSIDTPTNKIFFPDQCHTNRVRVIETSDTEPTLSETDALICQLPGICIAVLAADCVPVLLYDPENRVCAAIHAGWKGTVQRIVKSTVEKMQGRFGTQPKNLVAGIGPAISQEKYEVGDEVGDRFVSLFGADQAIIDIKSETGRYHINLKEANRRLLVDAGVLQEQIELMGLCTYAEPKLFFSARRDGFHSGRFAAGIMLSPGG